MLIGNRSSGGQAAASGPFADRMSGWGRSCRCGFEDDLVAEGLELADEVAGLAGGVEMALVPGRGPRHRPLPVGLRPRLLRRPRAGQARRAGRRVRADVRGRAQEPRRTAPTVPARRAVRRRRGPRGRGGPARTDLARAYVSTGGRSLRRGGRGGGHPPGRPRPRPRGTRAGRGESSEWVSGYISTNSRARGRFARNFVVQGRAPTGPCSSLPPSGAPSAAWPRGWSSSSTSVLVSVWLKRWRNCAELSDRSSSSTGSTHDPAQRRIEPGRGGRHSHRAQPTPARILRCWTGVRTTCLPEHA